MTLKEETKRHILKMMLLGDAGRRAKYPDLWSDTASIEAVLAADGGVAQAEEADPAKRQKIADLQARKQEALRAISQTFEKVQSNPRLDNGGDDRVNGVNQLLINLDAFLQDREAYEYYHRMFYEWSLDADAEHMAADGIGQHSSGVGRAAENHRTGRKRCDENQSGRASYDGDEGAVP